LWCKIVKWSIESTQFVVLEKNLFRPAFRPVLSLQPPKKTGALKPRPLGPGEMKLFQGNCFLAWLLIQNQARAMGHRMLEITNYPG
jgi:hypothetical protein